MTDAFISYSRKDSEFVHKLDNALSNAGRNVWVDWEDIARGEDWWREIEIGAQNTDTVLIVVTENWLLSEICNRELEYARQHKKRVFPIIRQQIKDQVEISVKGRWMDQSWEQRARDNWKYLRGLNWLFFDDDTKFDASLADLLRAMDSDLPYIKAHTRYQVRALEWDQSKNNPSYLLEGDDLTFAENWLTGSLGKSPEPTDIHHVYIKASRVGTDVRTARETARENLARQSRRAAIILGIVGAVAVVATLVAIPLSINAINSNATSIAQVTVAGATLQQVNTQVVDAVAQQATARAEAQNAQQQVATATIEQGLAVIAQQTSSAREQVASTQVAVAGATLSPVPPTLTAVASAIANAETQQDIALNLVDAGLRLNDGQPAQALQIADQIVAIYPDEALSYIGRGLLLEVTDQLDEAMADYTKAIQLDPQNAAGYLNRGNLYEKSDEYDKAIADYDQAIEVEPEFPDAYLNRGIAHLEHGFLDQAIADFTQTLTIDPSYINAYTNRAVAYGDQGKLDEALADYNQAIQLDPQNASSYSDRGNLYQKAGEYDKAIADYDKAIEIDPEYADAYFNRGIAQLQRGFRDQAIADFTQTLAIDPSYINAYNNRAVAYRDQGKLDEAMADYNQALQITPQDADLYLNRGNLYATKQDFEKALADYNTSLQFNPQQFEAYISRGYLYYLQSEFDLALQDFNTLLANNPQDVAVHFTALTNRGLVYAVQQENQPAYDDYHDALDLLQSEGITDSSYIDIAVTDLSDALQKTPDNPSLYIFRGLLQDALGDREQADDDWAQAQTLGAQLPPEIQAVVPTLTPTPS